MVYTETGHDHFFNSQLSGKVLGYGLDDGGFDSRQGLSFFLHHCIQTSSGAHPASYPMGTRGFFPGGKAAET
jgi:hypothetical protein